MVVEGEAEEINKPEEEAKRGKTPMVDEELKGGDGEVKIGTPLLKEKRGGGALEVEDDYDDDEFESHVAPSESRASRAAAAGAMKVEEGLAGPEGGGSRVISKPFGMKKKKKNY